MKNILISQELLQAIADYLQAKPFREVAAMLQAIQLCKPVEEPSDGPKA